MAAPLITTERQRELIATLSRLVALRATDEVAIRERFDAREADARTRHETERNRLTAEFERAHARAIEAYQTEREAIFFEYESAGAALVVEEERFRDEQVEQLSDRLEDAKSAWQIQRKAIEETFVRKDADLQSKLSAFQQQCRRVADEVNAIEADAQKIVRRRGFSWPDAAEPATIPPGQLSQQQHLDRAKAALERARHRLAALPQQPADKFLQDGWPVLIFLLAIPVAAALCWWLLSAQGWPWIVAGSLLLPLSVSVTIRQIMRPIARRQVLGIVPQFQQALGEAIAESMTALQQANVAALERKNRRIKRRERALAEAKEAWEVTRSRETAEHQARLEQAITVSSQNRKSIEDSHESRLHEVESKHPPRIEQLEREYERQMLELSKTYRTDREASREQFEQEWNDLARQWSSGLAGFQAAIDEMNGYCDAHFPAWNATEAATTTDPKQDAITALRFGRYALSLETQDGDARPAEGLASPFAPLELPAVLSYPDRPSLLLEAEGEGRDEANRALQNVMLRLLTTFPPGKVRFTIIDPVGLGQNFSAFMHLADYDRRLVTNRIWTESIHINQRLADLTEHMEDVIQKYLRNQFDSIQEYNEHAGEVAEPFQILVVANFPANFSDEAARRLVSIASSGARCGVYTLISTDNRLKLPRNFDLADLEGPAATLIWDDEHKRFAWKHEDIRRLPLVLESPPADARFTQIVQSVGQQAKDSSRVEVPFESVLPQEGAWWSADSRSEIEVPLGRAGAMKLQSMRLGKGTSQHVLIAGKTGSGKSTLLNALITNLAAHYSPAELEFYLIDFKKGVEFKAYATHRLPHARVIAIESEREFGMSVLERLDAELKRRGDLFRQAGVQDVKGYRGANPDAVMPRVLLIIDEFQEFFTSDDKISHDAGLLLDRLVRQGRAFGIHVLLGSQTLAGAYSLARSTLGQMAVRIALQCSESDAHLILSEENSAARLLSRPGEAIYNDANGLFEGNHPFQVVWLSDLQRETCLRRLANMAADRKVALSPPTVFEGNVAANPADNGLLRRLLEAAAPAEMPPAPRAWLGAAVAIKDPTDVVFRRQGGSNLLIVGQQEGLALGVLANSLVSFAAQLPHRAGAANPAGNGASAASDLHPFYVLDGSRPESPESGFWRHMHEQLVAGARIAGPHDAAQVVGQIAAEVDRRLAESDRVAEPLFLFVYNLARFRDLKKSDDFSSFDDEGGGNAAKQLTTILREGPALGVHTLIWCDSYNNVNRWLDRQSLRDLDQRVLFQMSAADSSNLMDSPAASRLGIHLALYHSEELGRAEKFRPYGPPAPEWLAWVAEQLIRRPTPASSAT